MYSSVKSTQDNSSLDVDEGISDRGSDSEVDSKFKSVTLSNSISDPSLGQCNVPMETGSEGRTSSPIGASCSSQDTSTSAEFSLNTNCSVESGGDNYSVDDHVREPIEHCDSDEQTAPPSPGDRGINDMDTHLGNENGDNWDSQNKGENWDTENRNENCDTENKSENWDADEVTIVHEEPFKHFFQVVEKDEDLLSKQRCKYNHDMFIIAFFLVFFHYILF